MLTNHTTYTNKPLKIEPYYDGCSTAITKYKVVDSHGNILLIDNLESCQYYLMING